MSLMKNFNHQIYPYFLGLEMFADQIHWYFSQLKLWNLFTFFSWMDESNLEIEMVSIC